MKLLTVACVCLGLLAVMTSPANARGRGGSGGRKPSPRSGPPSGPPSGACIECADDDTQFCSVNTTATDCSSKRELRDPACWACADVPADACDTGCTDPEVCVPIRSRTCDAEAILTDVASCWKCVLPRGAVPAGACSAGCDADTQECKFNRRIDGCSRSSRTDPTCYECKDTA
eukprot:m.246800 g.246800  ORF g.246800 m.246800 type:complete len:174 (-) comp19069_c0_seq7:140-661(-)